MPSVIEQSLDEIATLRKYLREIRDLSAENADLDADPSDTSPEDANQWRFGIIVQKCQKALGET